MTSDQNKEKKMANTAKDLEVSDIQLSKIQINVPDTSENTNPQPARSLDTLISSHDVKTFGRYQIQKKQGAGGMGEVYKAYDPILDRIVALKIMYKNISNSATERFLTEAKTNAKLIHNNIAKIFDIGYEKDTLFFTMEFIDGETLDCYVKRDFVGLLEKLRIVICIAKALKHAHQQGIVHRDLKPSNIMVQNSTKQPYIIDFGLAKILGSSNNLTQTDAIIGTPYYMSPEQVRAENDTVDTRSDIYSLGVILYEMLTGRRSFECTNKFELLISIVEKEPKSPNTIDKKIPHTLNSICLKALHKDKEKRYQNVNEFVEDLTLFLEEKSLQKASSNNLRLFLEFLEKKGVTSLKQLAFIKQSTFHDFDTTLEMSGLDFFEGAWISEEENSLHYGVVFEDKLFIPYCYNHPELQAHFFDCHFTGKLLFAKFEWLEQDFSGYAVFEPITSNIIIGVWWYRSQTSSSQWEALKNSSTLKEIKEKASFYLNEVTRIRKQDTPIPLWVKDYIRMLKNP